MQMILSADSPDSEDLNDQKYRFILFEHSNLVFLKYINQQWTYMV
jgi:hypothetical protein